MKNLFVNSYLVLVDHTDISHFCIWEIFTLHPGQLWAFSREAWFNLESDWSWIYYTQIQIHCLISELPIWLGWQSHLGSKLNLGLWPSWWWCRFTPGCKGGTSLQCAQGMNKFYSSCFPASAALGFSQDCTSFHFPISHFPLTCSLSLLPPFNDILFPLPTCVP